MSPLAVTCLLTAWHSAGAPKWTVLGHWWVLATLAIDISLITTRHQLFRTWLRTQAASTEAHRHKTWELCRTPSRRACPAGVQYPARTPTMAGRVLHG